MHVTKFSTLDHTRVLSCSDDTTVRLWDVPSQSTITTFISHTDYVRSGQFSSTDPHLILTGSYDGTVRILDTRTGECELLMGSTSGRSSASTVPVEQVLMYPSGTVALSAAGSILRVWDIVAGGRCLRAMSNHQKTVTSLAFNANSSRLLTGGLDHMVKVYDISNYNVVHTMRYSAPVICLALSVRRYALALRVRGFDDLRCSPMRHTSLSACLMERFPFVDDSQKHRKRLQLMATCPKPPFAQPLSNLF